MKWTRSDNLPVETDLFSPCVPVWRNNIMNRTETARHNGTSITTTVFLPSGSLTRAVYFLKHISVLQSRENWNGEKARDMSKATQLASGRTWIRTRSSDACSKVIAPSCNLSSKKHMSKTLILKTKETFYETDLLNSKDQQSACSWSKKN